MLVSFVPAENALAFFFEVRMAMLEPNVFRTLFQRKIMNEAHLQYDMEIESIWHMLARAADTGHSY
jgi:hypothetical protein